MLLALVLAAGGFEGTWSPQAQLEDLACVTAWENLCAVSGKEFPTVEVKDGRVTLKPFMDDDLVVYTVKSASDRVLKLTSKDGEATLTIAGERIQFSGDDAGELIRGKHVHVEQVFVRDAVVRAKQEALVKKLVPGGKCEGLMGRVEKPKGARCLNPPK